MADESKTGSSDDGAYVVTRTELYEPSLEEGAAALEAAMKAAFAEVSVAVVDCPDLSEAGDGGWGLASKGLGCKEGRKPFILDLGGVDNLCVPSLHWRVYDMDAVAVKLGMESAAILGAGAGLPSVAGRPAEAMPNMHFGLEGGNRSTYATVDDDDKPEQGKYDSSTFGLFQNLLSTDGLPGKVIEVRVKGRKTEGNFTDAIKAALDDSFDGREVAVGGVFRLSGAPMNVHIMDFFPTEPCNVMELIGRLKRFEFPAEKLTCLTTAVSGKRIRPANNPHTHCFGTEAGHVGGHYHFDTDGETAEYVAYLVYAAEAVHVELPKKPAAAVEEAAATPDTSA